MGLAWRGEDLDADIIRTAPTGQVTRVASTTSEQVIKSSPGRWCGWTTCARRPEDSRYSGGFAYYIPEHFFDNRHPASFLRPAYAALPLDGLPGAWTLKADICFDRVVVMPGVSLRLQSRKELGGAICGLMVQGGQPRENFEVGLADENKEPVGEALTGHGGFYFIPGRQESPPGEVGNRCDLELSPAGLEVSSLQGVPVRVSYSWG